jgi:hypothetical protein
LPPLSRVRVATDAYTSWEWSTLCDEIRKLEVDLQPANLIVLPLAKGDAPETTAASAQVFASDFATRDRSEMISDAYQWRRWESNPRAWTRSEKRGVDLAVRSETPVM